ncbi:MAG: helix-turn-helix transcriptional regulator, partial [Ilumatobacteraceae bacterium]|nr:helix-turn-helix domain-containing protein [Ilumatobacteraceae bacterium]HRC48658.1 helix-turn-helix domain-containing protein [Ilumatobacteraceae bacterium]
MPANSPSFTSTVSAITDAFGDPTRRGIYLFAREEAAGVTATQVAEKFGVHPNVARHHLDKLAAGGYLEVAVERAEGAGAGRPSKHYRVSADAKVDLTGDVPVHSDDLVLSLLGRALALLPHDKAEAMAEEVGQEYGLAMAQGLTGADLAVGQRSLRSAMQAVADALTAHGFAAHADQRNNQLRIVNNHCPFGDVAIEHPVICAVDRGMVKGMLTALYGATDVATMQSLPQGDT